MARNGAGTFDLATGNPVITGTQISSSWANNTLSDIASALTQSVAADGQTPITANMPFNGFKLQGVGDGVLDDDVMTVGQGITSADLANTSNTALGDALEGVKKTAVNAVATTQHLINENRSIDAVLDFGADPTGVSSSSTAIDNAIIAARLGNKEVILPPGTYLYGGTQLQSLDVMIIGASVAFPAFNVYSASVGTTIKWTGGVSPFVGTGLNNFGKWGLKDITLDCNSVATFGINIRGGNGGYFKNVFVKNPTYCGLWMDGGHIVNSTCSWNTFDQLKIRMVTTGSPIAAIVLTADPLLGNACHNVFSNTYIDYGGTGSGIYLGGCDNNTFHMTYIYQQPGGTGSGVVCDPTIIAGFPVNTTFYHLEAGGGWFQPNTMPVNAYNSVYGYMTDNGQPLPVIQGGTLFYVMGNGQTHGFNVTEKGAWAPTTTGITFVGANNSSYKYVKTGDVVQINITLVGATSVAIAAGATITLPFTAATNATGLVISANDVTKNSQFIAYTNNINISTACVAEPSYTLSFAYTV